MSFDFIYAIKVKIVFRFRREKCFILFRFSLSHSDTFLLGDEYMMRKWKDIPATRMCIEFIIIFDFSLQCRLAWYVLCAVFWGWHLAGSKSCQPPKNTIQFTLCLAKDRESFASNSSEHQSEASLPLMEFAFVLFIFYCDRFIQFYALRHQLRRHCAPPSSQSSRCTWVCGLLSWHFHLILNDDGNWNYF